MTHVNVKPLKEIKDLKEHVEQKERSQSVCPPLVQQSSGTDQSTRLLAINPLIMVFEGTPGSQCQKTLNITNISNERVAWRVLCNAPTRYIVSPNKGFLFKQEKTTIQITLLNGAKYHRRHAFVVQSKPAKMEENNRMLAWRDTSPADTKYVQSIRVSTLNAGGHVSKPGGIGGFIAKKIASTPSCNGGIGADDIIGEVAIVKKNGKTKIIDGATYRYGLASSSESKSASSAEMISGSSASLSTVSVNTAVNEADHGEYTEKIKQLTEAVKKAAEQKQNNTQRMVAAVNEVKKLEVELDRAGQNLNQIQQKYNEQDEAVTILRSRLAKVREQLAIAREADRRRNA